MGIFLFNFYAGEFQSTGLGEFSKLKIKVEKRKELE